MYANLNLIFATISGCATGVVLSLIIYHDEKYDRVDLADSIPLVAFGTFVGFSFGWYMKQINFIGTKSSAVIFRLLIVYVSMLIFAIFGWTIGELVFTTRISGLIKCFLVGLFPGFVLSENVVAGFRPGNPEHNDGSQ